MPASRSPTSPSTSTSTSPRQRPSTCSPWRPAWTRWSSASRRSSASCGRPTGSGAELGTVGTVLHDLAQTALRVGKRVHADTGIDRAGASIVSVALDLAERQVGSLAGRRGAARRRRVDGRAGRGHAAPPRAHRHRGREPVAASGRRGWPPRLGRAGGTPGRARRRARRRRHRGCPRPAPPGWSWRPTASARADDRPLVVLDLALPRDVDPTVGSGPASPTSTSTSCGPAARLSATPRCGRPPRSSPRSWATTSPSSSAWPSRRRSPRCAPGRTR